MRIAQRVIDPMGAAKVGSKNGYGVLCALAIVLTGAQAAAQELRQGTIERSCTSFDSPGFVIELPSGNGHFLTLLRVNAALENAEQSWSVQLDGSAPRAATAAICHWEWACDLAVGGVFKVTRSWGFTTVHYDLELRSGGREVGQADLRTPEVPQRYFCS